MDKRKTTDRRKVERRIPKRGVNVRPITQSEMKDLNDECCQANCNTPATHVVFWPGDGKKKMCTEHAQKARRVANAMGFSVHVEEL